MGGKRLSKSKREALRNGNYEPVAPKELRWAQGQRTQEMAGSRVPPTPAQVEHDRYHADIRRRLKAAHSSRTSQSYARTPHQATGNRHAVRDGSNASVRNSARGGSSGDSQEGIAIASRLLAQPTQMASLPPSPVEDCTMPWPPPSCPPRNDLGLIHLEQCNDTNSAAIDSPMAAVQPSEATGQQEPASGSQADLHDGSWLPSSFVGETEAAKFVNELVNAGFHDPEIHQLWLKTVASAKPEASDPNLLPSEQFDTLLHTVFAVADPDPAIRESAGFRDEAAKLKSLGRDADEVDVVRRWYGHLRYPGKASQLLTSLPFSVFPCTHERLDWIIEKLGYTVPQFLLAPHTPICKCQQELGSARTGFEDGQENYNALEDFFGPQAWEDDADWQGPEQSVCDTDEDVPAAAASNASELVTAHEALAKPRADGLGTQKNIASEKRERRAAGLHG